MSYNSEAILKKIQKNSEWRDDGIRKVSTTEFSQKSMRLFLVNEIHRRFTRRIKKLQHQYDVAKWHESREQVVAREQNRPA